MKKLYSFFLCLFWSINDFLGNISTGDNLTKDFDQQIDYENEEVYKNHDREHEEICHRLSILSRGSSIRIHQEINGNQILTEFYIENIPGLSI